MGEEPVTSVTDESTRGGELNLQPLYPTPRTPRLSAPVLIADRPQARQRRRSDLVDCVTALAGIVGLWLFGVYANSTTRGVAEDVLKFEIIRDILLLPITFLEGIVILVAPVAVIANLLIKQRLRSTIEAILAAGVAAAIGWGTLQALAYLPPWMTAPLRVSTGTVSVEGIADTTIALNLVVIILSALFTGAGEAPSSRTLRWSWVGLWAITILWVIRLSMTLPSAFISLLIGRAVGCAMRWISGFENRSAQGPELVNALLTLGVVPTRIVRCDLDTQLQPLTTWLVEERVSAAAQRYLKQVPHESSTGAYEVPRRPNDGHRHYRVWNCDDQIFDVTALDPGRDVTGTLMQVWENIRLRGLSRWVAPSAKAAAERSTLTALSASRAGVRLPEPVGMAVAGESLLLVNEPVPAAVPLHELPSEMVSDHFLDEAWRQLSLAHRRSVAHRALDFDSIYVDDGGHIWLIHWEQGEAGASEVTLRIDTAQMLVHLTLVAGMDRALASASRVIGEENLRLCAPFLQRAVLPSSIGARLRGSDLLEQLRGSLVADPTEASSFQLANIQRFAPRTVIMSTVLFVALVAIAGSLNISQLRTTISSANLMWIGVAFAASTLTWLGASIALLAFSSERLRLRDAFLAQVAASLVTLVTPAGIGPAALNLRYLTKQKVAPAVAMTTVTLQQLAQLAVTVGLLVVLLLFSGQRLSVSLPYGTIVATLGVALAGIAVVAIVPKLRRWVWVKIQPTWLQVYPRLLWFVGHPRRIAAVIVGNIITIVGFVGCFWACVKAMGATLNLTTLTVTYLTSNSLGSLIPSPGGIGPVEAALTGGLQVAGISLSVALSIALLYRLVTFYGRAPLGWIAMKIMERKDLI